jgi:hypothetical protein
MPSIQLGQDIIFQKSIKRRIEKEIDGSGSQPGIGEISKWNYGRYGKPGHNMRTYEEGKCDLHIESRAAA